MTITRTRDLVAQAAAPAVAACFVEAHATSSAAPASPNPLEVARTSAPLDTVGGDRASASAIGQEVRRAAVGATARGAAVGELDRARARWTSAHADATPGEDVGASSGRARTTGVSGSRERAAAAVMPAPVETTVPGASGLGAMGTGGTVVGLGQHADKIPKVPESVTRYAPGLGAAGTALGAAASAGRVAAGVADWSSRGATPENVGEVTGGVVGVAGAIGGPVLKAFSTGFSIGQWIDKNVGISDAIGRLANPTDDGLDVGLPRLSALRPWAARDARVRELVGALEQYAAYEDRAARAVNAASRAKGRGNVAHLVPSRALREAGHAAARRPIVDRCRTDLEGRGLPGWVAKTSCETMADQHVRTPSALRKRIIELARTLEREAAAVRGARR